MSLKASTEATFAVVEKDSTGSDIKERSVSKGLKVVMLASTFVSPVTFLLSNKVLEQ